MAFKYGTNYSEYLSATDTLKGGGGNDLIFVGANVLGQVTVTAADLIH
jgi:hypothetical protein